MRIYQNVSAVKANWLAIDLMQTGVNTSAIGAWITLRVAGTLVHRELTIGGGHAGGSLLPQHFGLGSAKLAQVQVTWPDQTQSDWIQLTAGKIHSIIKN